MTEYRQPVQSGKCLHDLQVPAAEFYREEIESMMEVALSIFELVRRHV